MDNEPQGGADCERVRFRDRVGDRHVLDVERPDLMALVVVGVIVELIVIALGG